MYIYIYIFLNILLREIIDIIYERISEAPIFFLMKLFLVKLASITSWGKLEGSRNLLLLIYSIAYISVINLS